MGGFVPHIMKKLRRTMPMAMELAMATLIGTFVFVIKFCADPCTLRPCGCFRATPASTDGQEKQSARLACVETEKCFDT